MTSVYLILAHRNFDQLSRLAKRLLASDAGVVIHVDKGVEIPSGFMAGFPKNVLLTEQRFFTAWGSFELVEASIALLTQGMKHFAKAKYFSLLSGQDYPIKSPKYLDDFFCRSNSDFIRCGPLVEEHWKYGGKRRINKFYWAKNRKSLAGFVFRSIPLPPRRFPIPADKIFVGSQWWSLRASTVQRILQFVQEHPEVLKAFRHTYIPDEMFFQTVIAGFLHEKNLANDNLRFIEHFSLPRDYWRLKILNRNGIKDLGAADYQKLIVSPALFARKFDAAKDARVLDLLDAHAASETGSAIS